MTTTQDNTDPTEPASGVPTLAETRSIARRAGTDDETIVEPIRRRRRADNVIPLGAIERRYGEQISAAWPHGRPWVAAPYRG